MKFISKSSNLLVILRPGLSAQPLTGTPAKPSISVRFIDGVAEVKQEDMIEMMQNHPGFESDFISADVNTVDPYAISRTESEPAHEVAEIKYGAPEGRKIIGGSKPKISPAIQKIIAESAAELAKKMLPDMVKSTLEAIVDNKKKKTTAVGVDQEKEEKKESSIPAPIVEITPGPSIEEIKKNKIKATSVYGKGSRAKKKA